MPKTPRGKRVADAATDSFRVVNKAPNGEAQPYFDKSRNVWVAPWRKPDGKVGKPTGKTRALAVASRDRHLAKAEDDKRFADLEQGFSVTCVTTQSIERVSGPSDHMERVSATDCLRTALDDRFRDPGCTFVRISTTRNVDGERLR